MADNESIETAAKKSTDISLLLAKAHRFYEDLDSPNLGIREIMASFAKQQTDEISAQLTAAETERDELKRKLAEYEKMEVTKNG